MSTTTDAIVGKDTLEQSVNHFSSSPNKSSPKQQGSYLAPQEDNSKYGFSLLGASNKKPRSLTSVFTKESNSAIVKLNLYLLGGSSTGKNSFVKALVELYEAKSIPVTKSCTSFLVRMGPYKYDVSISCMYNPGFYLEEIKDIEQADGFFIMYDISNKFSVERARLFIRKARRIKKQDKTPMVLIGNKCDLEEQRQVSIKQGIQIGDECKIPFFETSCITRKTIKNAFEELVHAVETVQKVQAITMNGIEAMEARQRRSVSLFNSIPESRADEEFRAIRERKKAKLQPLTVSSPTELTGTPTTSQQTSTTPSST